jgi:type I restriction enzyme R subunit
MSTQPEQILENQLIEQLQKLGYKYITLHDEKALLDNLKSQIEKHNKISLSDNEFERILNLLKKGSLYEKAKTLRARQHIIRDNGDNLYFEFIQTEHWCQNEFQVTNQVTLEGTYKNRYDVTILINGLPLVQIELKRRGLELKEAFKQTLRYKRHSYSAGAGLFQYIQIFVISNGVNTKYYANNPLQALNFKQTFYWSDVKNNKLTNILNGFSHVFLEPCHISKMICRYIVLQESSKLLMVLRPYQYYAVEAILDRVMHSKKNGYIWHTTGSGKTLTSYKASQLITDLPKVKKVVFVVDRKDLDYQTAKEFNSFSDGSVDSTENTRKLVKQFGNDTKLIVTTIQKLNAAISRARFLDSMNKHKDERIVFIFDECHRSQFGETHKKIVKFFTNIQMFGFTGTPIFADNAVGNDLGKRTTHDLFEDCLHKYVITDAIRDENVLKFSVEYVGKYKRKDSATEIDIEVEAIDTKELMESKTRLNKIADYIIAHHARKTHSKAFTAMFCVSSIDTLTKYYDLFKSKNSDLKIATIFSYNVNEEDEEATGDIPDAFSMAADLKVTYNKQKHKHSREKLDDYIEDYNKTFGTAYNTTDTKSFYEYYNDVSRRVKAKEVDLLLVVNMFLTGFDAKWLNTLFVDKNLKYHGLIQAYSRTNRILNEKKSQGNIVVFRNLKDATDKAITLFSNKEAIEEIIMQPYEVYVKSFNIAFIELLRVAPTKDSVNDLQTEEDELEFIKAFRSLMRIKNILNTFSDFTWGDLSMPEQQFEDYKSKYLDLYEKVKMDSQKEKVSILDDVDFELELIHRDEINVTYILQLLAKLKSGNKKQAKAAEKEIFNLLNTDKRLRSKRELIEEFIESNMPHIKDIDTIPEEFTKYWDEKQKQAFETIVKEEKLILESTQNLIDNYLYAEREPLRDEVLALLEGEQPTLLKRKSTGDRILKRILDFVETFIEGMV